MGPKSRGELKSRTTVMANLIDIGTTKTASGSINSLPQHDNRWGTAAPWRRSHKAKVRLTRVHRTVYSVPSVQQGVLRHYVLLLISCVSRLPALVCSYSAQERSSQALRLCILSRVPSSFVSLQKPDSSVNINPAP
jgi:hypothetical protein